MVKVGSIIRILKLYGEDNSYYEGRMGKVTKFDTDCNGKRRMWGTWGGIAVYLNEDSWEIVK